MKTSELTGRALAWAVATCLGYTNLREERLDAESPHFVVMDPPRKEYGSVLLSSIDLDFESIIERERISVVPLHHDWEATLELDEGDAMVQVSEGPTPRIAAFRCLVASNLGDDVDVPACLLT